MNLVTIADAIDDQPVAISVGSSEEAYLRDAAGKAQQIAFDVDSLLDGTETDELAAILVPVRDFLKNLAGL